LGVEAKGGCVLTTEDIIVHLFCLVDDRLGAQHKEPLAKLYPSEVVTIGILFALKGVSFRAFERWLRRDWNALFGGLPDRQAARWRYGVCTAGRGGRALIEMPRLKATASSPRIDAEANTRW